MSEETQKRIIYLYRITNSINNKIYIGQTVDPIRRWYEHKREASRDVPNMLISKAIRKHGNQNFEFEVIASCKTYEGANDLETYLVKQYSSLTPLGYNVTLGGYNAPKSDAWREAMKKWHASMSKEEKEQRSELLREATFRQIEEKGHPAQGRIVTEKEKELHRKSRLENPLDYTEELRQKMSEAHIGIKDSEETKQKKSESAATAWEQRIDYSRRCEAPGCEIHGKAKYKIINNIRYCNKHGLRILRYGRLDRLNP
jgi:group I intron endonuclease